uniref:hypothetical protein n=1 Tax=Okeania sp. SIO2F4 TaxID=2607790 RepID=UPI0025EE4A4A|nr:hypothetical protein [Okeania sp. SIO2F4]
MQVDSSYHSLGGLNSGKVDRIRDGMVAKQARIVKKATGYYLLVSFPSTELVSDNPVGKISLGIDAGIESFLATSTGKLIKSPKFLLLPTAQAEITAKKVEA